MASVRTKICWLCLLSLLLIYVESTTLNRVVVPNAKCLDGSPYSYYISQGTNHTSFYLNHQGGGWCQDLNECAERAKSALGTSINWTATVDMGDGMSRDASTNPLMKDWTFVYLPYCDGGSFTGDAMSSSGPQLYFQGLKIRQAVAASLRALNGFDDTATDLVVGGCSAGGLAAYLHVDWWASQVPKAKARGLPDSGFFLDGDYNRDGKPNYEARMSNMYNFMNSQAGISPACNQKLGYKCLFAYHLIPFLKTPVLALNSAYDATMGNGDCGHSGIVFDWTNTTSVNLCGNYIRMLVQQLLMPPSAVFLDSCRHHCGEWGAITIDGTTSPKALNVWYNTGSHALPKDGDMDQGAAYPCDKCCG